MSEPRKIIIDTDPGQDDAAAIMLALGSPELDILGITTVAGNVPLSRTSTNARIILEFCARQKKNDSLQPPWWRCAWPAAREQKVLLAPFESARGADAQIQSFLQRPGCCFCCSELHRCLVRKSRYAGLVRRVWLSAAPAR